MPIIHTHFATLKDEKNFLTWDVVKLNLIDFVFSNIFWKGFI